MKIFNKYKSRDKIFGDHILYNTIIFFCFVVLMAQCVDCIAEEKQTQYRKHLRENLNAFDMKYKADIAKKEILEMLQYSRSITNEEKNFIELNVLPVLDFNRIFQLQKAIKDEHIN